jgi:hypothetical protein
MSFRFWHEAPVLLTSNHVRAGEFEQITWLCARQPQSTCQASERRPGNRHLAALLDPSAPGDAHSAELGKLLAPEPWRAASFCGSKSAVAGVWRSPSARRNVLRKSASVPETGRSWITYTIKLVL